MSPDSHGLPGVLGEIAEIAGTTAALQLAQERGGTRVYLPYKPKPDHWLAACVGMKAAEAICSHFATRNADDRQVGTFDLLIPLAGTGANGKLRRRLIAALRQGDAGVKRVARSVGVHERTVWRVKAKLKNPKDNRQPDLFGDETG